MTPKNCHPLVWKLATQLLVQTPIKTSSHRLLFGAFSYRVPQLPTIPLEDLGFVPKSKFGQLKRNYWNPTGAEEVKAHLASRAKNDFTSLTLRLNGLKKARSSQGYCITNLVLSHSQGVHRAVVQYRSTEVFCKHLADWTFLNWVYDQLGVAPAETTFQFANCYATAMFFPSLFNFVDPEAFFSWTSTTVPDKHEFLVKYFHRMFSDPNARSGFGTQRRQHRLAWSDPPRWKLALGASYGH